MNIEPNNTHEMGVLNHQNITHPNLTWWTQPLKKPNQYNGQDHQKIQNVGGAMVIDVMDETTKKQMGAMDEIIEMINKVDETTQKSEWREQNHKKQVGGKNH